MIVDLETLLESRHHLERKRERERERERDFQKIKN